MKTFNNQFELTAHWEQGPNGGPALKAYRCPAGIWTIGYGETMPDGNLGNLGKLGKLVTPDMTCTEEQARQWLSNRLERIKQIFSATFSWGVMSSCMDAIVDFAYNVGIDAFPHLINKIKKGSTEDASLEFLDGFYCNGKPLLGLLLRRISEYNTFRVGEYVAWEKGDPITRDLKDKLIEKNKNHPLGLEMINTLKEQQ